jgi:hypothetical protein
MNAYRISITLFVVALLAIVTLGFVWTGNNQPPPQSTASQVVLGIAAVTGVWALVKIWRHDPSRGRARRA